VPSAPLGVSLPLQKRREAVGKPGFLSKLGVFSSTSGLGGLAELRSIRLSFLPRVDGRWYIGMAFFMV
jgi:hypothetical protein